MGGVDPISVGVVSLSSGMEGMLSKLTLLGRLVVWAGLVSLEVSLRTTLELIRCLYLESDSNSLKGERV